MNELIERLEKAQGPHYRLSQDIGEALNLPGHYRYQHPGSENQSWPHYTASIDAALRLIPDGLFWSISHGRTKSGEPLGGVSIRTPLLDVVSEAEAETTELAICIAALKARGAVQQSTTEPK